MRTAYLLAVFRLDGDVPVFMHAGIFGEPDPTLPSGCISFIVAYHRGVTLADARRQLLVYLDGEDRFEWAARSLKP